MTGSGGGRPRTLLLFDIDGTLVLTGRAGTRAMTRSFEAVLGIPDALESVDVAGRTDRLIVRDALAQAGRPPIDEATFERFRDLYCELLSEEIVKDGTGGKGVLPGVRPLLDALVDRDDVRLALLTGNFRRSAEIKLAYFDLWRYFDWGVFGDEALDREHLMPIALERQRQLDPPIDPVDVVVIGDTPHDIRCARFGNTRVVAVATGHYSFEELAPHAPDALFADLGDLEAVLAALFRTADSHVRSMG